MQIGEFQTLIRKTYGKRDVRRGLALNYMWFVEEIGELSEALRFGTKQEMEEEFADCLAWLMTLASGKGVDMEKAIEKYRHGCPRCRRVPCACPPA